jgi:hypothetical protein
MGLDLQRQLSAISLKVVVCLAMLGWMPLPGGCTSPCFMLIPITQR